MAKLGRIKGFNVCGFNYDAIDDYISFSNRFSVIKSIELYTIDYELVHFKSNIWEREKN